MNNHTKFRRFLAMAFSIIFAQGVLSSSVTAQSLFYSANNEIILLGATLEANVTTEAELKTIIESGQTAILGANIILTAPMLVPIGKSASLDLNGYTIDRGLTAGIAVLNGNVITVNGSLTLEDSQGGGKITGGRRGGYTGGGGVNVTGGTFTMNAGSICGNIANGYGGGVYVTSGGAFVMNGGVVSDNKTASNGGGVCVDSGTLTMSSGIISNNEAAGDGGGVYVNGSTFTMDNGTISENTAAGTGAGSGNGGGVAVLMGAVFTMNNGSINGNIATHYGGGAYGFIGGVIVINAGNISSNTADCGGGIYFDKSVNTDYGIGSLTINGGEVSSNKTVTGDGGGVYVAHGVFSMSNCKINNNLALTGGGVFSLGGTCLMDNSEISENSTFQDIMGHGGGVYIGGGSFTMQNSRVNKNSAVCGGGVYMAGGSFTQESGQINENSTYDLEGDLCDGGGVYVNTGCAFTMRGGEICGNTTSEWFFYRRGGGVYVNGGSFKVSGDVKILNNSRSGVPNNVYLHTSEHMIEVEGAITSADGAIGISTGASGESPLTVVQGSNYTLSEDDLKKFGRDTGGSLNLADNKITLPDPSGSYLLFLSYNANGGSGFLSSSAILQGMDNHMTVATGGSLSRVNCSFTGWNTKADGSGTAYQPGNTLLLTGNTVLYAQWSINKTEFTVTAPQASMIPTSSATCSTTGITTLLAWKLNDAPLIGNFNYNTIYSVELTLTAGPGCIFSSSPEATVNDALAVVQRISDTQLVVSYTFSKSNSRNAPTALLSKTTVDVASSGGSQSLTLNTAGIAEGCNAITWTMSKTEDNSNILTLPDITTGTLTNGELSLDSFTIASNATGQPPKSAKVTIVFGGNDNGDYAGVPLSLTVTFKLAAGASPEANLDFINEKIIAVSSTMEYIVTNSSSSPTDWIGAITVTGTEIPIGDMIPNAGADSKYIHIRYKNITGSISRDLEIPARPDLVTFFGSSWDSWVTDNIWTDFETGGVYEDFGYRINNGTDMINNTGGSLDVLLNPSDTLTFWMAATESSFKSAEIIVTAPARLTKPAVAINYSTGKLNTTADMEYRLDEAADWSSCTPDMDITDFGWSGTQAVNVWFRYPCTIDNYASEAQKLMILDTACIAAKSAAQAASYADMTQAEAINENEIKVAIKSTAEAAISNSSITVSISKVSYTEPVIGTVANPSGTNGSYTFTITISKDGQNDTTEQKTITITATAYTGSNNSNGNNSGSGNGSGSGSDSPTQATKPTKPVTGITENEATINSRGTAIVRITDQNIADAIANARAEAAKEGVNAGEITVAIQVSTDGKKAANLAVNLPKAAQKQIIDNNIAEIELKIDRPDITVGIDLAAIKQINRQANSDVLLTVNKKDGLKLSSAAKNTIGSRPVYDFNASYQNGSKSVTDFGDGTVYVSLPYTPAKNETVGYLYIAYVDSKGKVRRVSNSAYDANSKRLIFFTNHFSMYGVGYTAPNVKFTDITKHWAKNSIDYVVGRGLLNSTTKTTFSPNTVITRGMLVTALGRLAGVDTKKFTKTSFTDVKANSPLRPYIEWAYSQGILKGIGNRQFGPNRPVTREEIAVIMVNYAKATNFKLPVTRNAITYADTSNIDSNCVNAVRSLQQAGIIMGESNNKFNPKVNTTRAEVSAMLHRYIKLTIDPTTAQSWAQNDDGQYMYYKDSKFVTGWLTIDTNGSSKWYYFYRDGSLAVSTVVDGYEVDKNGVRKE